MNRSKEIDEGGFELISPDLMVTGVALPHIARLVARCLSAPLSIVALEDVDDHDLAQFGSSPAEARALLERVNPLLEGQDQPLIIADTADDQHPAETMSVAGSPIRFLAAATAPLAAGFEDARGLVAVFDYSPRHGIDEACLQDLQSLAALLRDEIVMRRGKRQLVKAHRDISMIFKTFPDILIFAEPDRRIRDVNRGFTRSFGYSKQEALGRTTAFLYAHREDYKRTDRRYNPRAPDQTESYNVEYQRKDGSIFRGETIGVHIRDNAGQTIGFLGITKDVTEAVRLEKERAEALEQLTRSQKLLQETSRMAAIGGGTFDIRSGEVQWSDQLYRIHEMPVGQPLSPQDTLQFFDAKDAETLVAHVERILERGESFELELPMTTARGRRRWVRTTGQPIVEDGQIIGVQGYLQDISEHKQAEDAKREFISVVSHELRTPLTSIRGTLGLIAHGVVGELPQEAGELLGVALRNTERLAALVDDILDIEKIESGKVKIELGPVDVTDVVNDVIETNQGFADEFNVALHADTRVPGTWICAHREKLHQVLTNLVSNAVKYSSEGYTVDLIAEKIDAETVRITVQDQGPGIPEEFQDSLFDRFTRADTSDTRRSPGTGLGLNIARALTEEMGGVIGFKTAPEQGTKMFVDFPILGNPPENESADSPPEI